MLYTGSCHCGQIRFEVEGEIEQVLECNCSFCSRKAPLLWFVPRAKMRLLTAENKITTYRFNRHVIKHQFCPNCGVQPFGEGVDPAGNPIAAINVRCLEGVDPHAFKVIQYDGRSK